MARIFALVCLFWACFQTAEAQFVKNTWTMEDGLPSGDVFDIAQTPDGFIWVATDNGLSRFDGVTFVTYDRSNTPEITRNVVRKLFVTSDGILLAGMSGGGVAAFDYRSGSFSRPYDDIIDPTMYVLSFAETDNSVWIGSDGGGLYQITGDEVVRHTDEGDLPRNHIFALERIGPEEVVVGPMNYGYWFGNEQGAFRSSGHEFPLAAALVYEFQFVDDEIWMATAGRGVFRYRDGELEIFDLRGYTESSHLALSFHKDSSGTIWIGTAEGIFFSNDNMETVRMYPGLELSFSLAITEDREGNVWIADWGRGLVRLKRATFSSISEDDGLMPGSSSSVAFAHGDLWIAGTGGVYRKVGSERLKTYTTDDGLSSSAPHLLLKDSNGRLLVSHFNPGTPIDYYDPESGRFRRLPFFERENLPNAYISVLYDDGEELWIGSGMGVYMWQEDPIFFINSDFGLVNNTVRALHRDGPWLWIGTNGGLHRMDVETREVEHITGGEEPMGSVITSLHTDADGNLWVGSFDGGLTVMMGDDFYTFDTSSGLPTDVIWHTIEDKLGYFWMGSTSGITRVNREQLLDYARGNLQELDTSFFTIRDGLSGSSKYGNHQPTAGIGPDGKIYFPGTNGVSIVEPERIIINDTPPVTRIEQILVDLENAPLEERLRLTHEARALEIQYTAPTFTSPGEVRFKYRLYPFEQSWQDVGTRRAAYYTTIPPGDYTFEVKAVNEYGVESLQAASVPVTVLPAFWETWWFMLSMVMLVFAVAYAGYRYKVYNYERMNNLRLRISKDLHDEIGSNLASIAIRSSVVKKREALSELTRQDLDEIRSLSRLTAESMRDIVWLINPDNDKMENLLVKLREVCSNMLMEIPWELHSNMDASKQPLELQKRRVLVLILKEALHNIVKHAEAEKVDISLNNEKDNLRLIVRDDGKGFDPQSKAGTGLGQKSMRERAAEIGGELTVKSAPGEGTRVELVLPF